ERGVSRCAKVWDFKKFPGEQFKDFCLRHYTPPGAARETLLEKLDYFTHSVGGYLGMMTKAVRRGVDIADSPLTPADELFGAFSAGTHLSEDLREFHIAPLAQLNFGTDDETPPRTRAAWAARRLSTVGREVVPAKLVADSSKASSESQRFVNAFNIYLDRIDFGDPEITFPKNTRLISHWGLRDYMTGLNGTEHALKRQRAVREIMRRVVDGELPRQLIDNPQATWRLGADTVTVSGKKEPTQWTAELRWEVFKNVYDTRRKIDPYTRYGNMIDNKFKIEREIAEDKVVKMLTDILSAPVATGVARFVESRLKRPIEPHDICFKSFHSGAAKRKLGYDLGKRYPDAAALTAAIPGVLRKLGFSKERAEFIGSRIRVDNSRSAGHAWHPFTREDTQLLRCRIDPGGISEQDFSVFMHELGHCVEGVLSSYEMDYYSLWGMPNTAFSEGFAFTFQDRTDFVLGRTAVERDDVTTLLRYWEAFEIAGPALVEIELFHWLYKTPRATTRQM
ncbi:MAG TPA: hypothetical protein VLB27_07635, partial [candidate division Zixibacteria bacterium]|nr:hypothetical protein [candidate division Zixibacteria bacterium]